MPGYIHPDEFFQGGQELFFGCQRREQGHFHDWKNIRERHGIVNGNNNESNINDQEYLVKNVPWEYEPNNALRSIVPPAFMTVFPLRLYLIGRSLLQKPLSSVYKKESRAIARETIKDGDDTTSSSSCNSSNSPTQKTPLESSFLWTHSMGYLTGREILIIPRLFMTILSVIFLDGSLWVILIAATARGSNRETRRKPQKPQSTESALFFSTAKMSLFSVMLNEGYLFGPPIEVILLASSWPCLVFGVRPFTNNLEAMVLAFLLAVVIMDVAKNGHDTKNNNHDEQCRLNNIHSPILVGITCSIGVFVRFTFAFYAFPAVCLFLWVRWKNMTEKNMQCLVYCLFWMALAFGIVSAFFVSVDTQYYSWEANLMNRNLLGEKDTHNDEYWGNFLKYIAPFNAFRYNSKSTNLAEHGLHPRITHSVVNMPMLFGPLALVGYASLFQRVIGTMTTKDQLPMSFTNSNSICQWVIFSGLFVLSCAPHQEPRFLLPCIVPLIFLHGRKVVSWKEIDHANSKETKSKLVLGLRLFWIFFNLILYLFFGWLHQGGLVSSLLHLPHARNDLSGVVSSQSSSPVFIYYHTYMPPSFLTRGDSFSDRSQEDVCSEDNKGGSSDNSCSALPLKSGIGCPQQSQSCGDRTILDLQGSDSTILLEVFRQWLVCPAENTSGVTDKVYVVSPPTVIVPLLEESPHNTPSGAHFLWKEYSFKRMYGHHNHVSTEDWPEFKDSVLHFWGQLELAVHEITCT